MLRRNVVIFSFVMVIIVMFGCSQSQQKSPDFSYTPPNATDTNWINGIFIHEPGFLIAGPIKAQTKSDFAVGRKAIFSDGTVRTIIKVKEITGNLIVIVDGAKLDGNVVGYPKTIKITDAGR